MAKYGSPDLKIEIDNASGTLVDLSEYIDEINELSLEALTQEGHTFGDEWVKQLFTGVKQGNELTVSGFYDDTVTTGPNAILNAIGATREVKITWGAAKTSTFDVIIRTYTRSPVRGELTRFSAALIPTGAILDV